MNKIKDIFKKLYGKWKEFTFQKKAIIILITVSLFITIALVAFFANRVTYATVYYGVSLEDSAKIIDKLKSENIKYKYEGDSILVPADKVNDVRISVASSGIEPSSPKGYELFDQSSLGTTDTQTQIMYQRALEGELTKTIQSLEGIDKASVHLVLPEESVFAKETENASASVTIKLKNGVSLTSEQVKGIVNLISYSVKNLPKKNVQVVDSNMNLLSEGLFDDDANGTIQTTKQMGLKEDYEKSVRQNIEKMLSPLFGQNQYSGRTNYAVTVSADLDFDSKQIDAVIYDKNPVVRSSKVTNENSSDSNGTSSSASPVDNNMTNSLSSSTNGTTSKTAKEETTINNEISQTNEKTVKAPGEVKRMSVSVVINDSQLTSVEKDEIKNIVATACGYDQTRGDSINISALSFNNDAENQIKKAEETYATQQAAKEKQGQLILYIVIGIACALGLLVLILLLKKTKNKTKAAVGTENPTLDVVVGDETGDGLETMKEEQAIKKQQAAYKPVLADNDVDMSLEKEIKDYATKKPEQVAEVIRSWLAEDER